MTTTLTKKGWLGTTRGLWEGPGTSNVIVDTKEGIRIPTGLPFEAIAGLPLNAISTGNKPLTLTGDISALPLSSASMAGNYGRQAQSGITNLGTLIVGKGGSTLTGTGPTGLRNAFTMVFGDGSNTVIGIGKRTGATGNGPQSYTGIANYGIMRFGSGSDVSGSQNNLLRGVGFFQAAKPMKPMVAPSPNDYNSKFYPSNRQYYGDASAIHNEGTILFDRKGLQGQDVVDALAGGFSGDGYLEFTGTNTPIVKGFGGITIGGKSISLQLNQGTYKILINAVGGLGGTPCSISSIGSPANMEIEGLFQIGSGISKDTQYRKPQEGTLTIDRNGKLTFESGISHDAYMVYDATTHLDPSAASYTSNNSFIDTSTNDLGDPSDPTYNSDGYQRHELRFASTTPGQTLTLYETDYGVGRVSIGTGAAAAAVRTATTALNVDASRLKWDLAIAGNDGNNILKGATDNAADNTFIGSLGSDSIDGGTPTEIGFGSMVGAPGTDSIDYSGLSLRVKVSYSKFGLATAQKLTPQGAVSGTDQLLNIDDVIIGTSLNDDISGNAAGNRIIGGLGLDILNGNGGEDIYEFLKGAEHTAAEINDTGNPDLPPSSDFSRDKIVFRSTTAGDTLKLFAGDKGIEVIEIGQPIDSLIANETDPTALNVDASAMLSKLTIFGNDGNNNIFGSSLDNTIYGRDGEDSISGGAGNDFILGDSGNDKINGGDGNDIITGGAGSDSLIGGRGLDRFIFNVQPDQTPFDRIIDFTPGEDKIMLEEQVFNIPNPSGSFNDPRSISEDQLLAASGAIAAKTKDQRFIYNTLTGDLRFDQDGSDSGNQAVVVAMLAPPTGTSRPAVTAADILIYQRLDSLIPFQSSSPI